MSDFAKLCKPCDPKDCPQRCQNQVRITNPSHLDSKHALAVITSGV